MKTLCIILFVFLLLCLVFSVWHEYDIHYSEISRLRSMGYEAAFKEAYRNVEYAFLTSYQINITRPLELLQYDYTSMARDAISFAYDAPFYKWWITLALHNYYPTVILVLKYCYGVASLVIMICGLVLESRSEKKNPQNAEL